MDLQNLTFAGLAAVGVVNVLTFFRPELDSKVKFAVSLVAAFAFSFIPEALSNVLLERSMVALQIAFMASGTYKIAQKVGGQ